MISIVQRGNLKALEQTLRKQWRLGQNIVLCWATDERGILVILVPHYFLGNFCAGGSDGQQGAEEEEYIRQLISGRRRKAPEALFKVAKRLGIAPTFIKLNTALEEHGGVLDEVEELIRRYGISYVDNRAVLLFDIVEFSLFTPFEQASQLNSLSYSLNSAYTKLLSQGVEINFARTTTGDGYYIWNRDIGPEANRNLFYFMLLVVADNAMARAASKGHTVPVIRTGYHIGSHYELYQAEGVNPTMFSYIVGDVTIELARMLGGAQAKQILVGDFNTGVAEQRRDAHGGDETVHTNDYVGICNRGLKELSGLHLSGKPVSSLAALLSTVGESDRPLELTIVDKHGLSRVAFNLQIDLELGGKQLLLGLSSEEALPLKSSGEALSGTGEASDADEVIGELSAMLKSRS